MAKAKKLPSGQWRTLVYSHTDESGKRHYESFTADSKRESEYQAALFALDRKGKKKDDEITLRDAMNRYIESRSEVLSPATIREYIRLSKRNLPTLMDKNIYDITQEMIQKAINAEAMTRSPKSVRNTHGLLSAVLRQFRPEMYLTTSLPQKIQPKLYIPTDEEVKKLFEYVQEDEDMTIAILLAAFGPLRRSEICGLESSDISGNVIHVQRAVVMDKNRQWQTKTTKSTAGDRLVPLPDFVIDRISQRNGKLVQITPAVITSRFIRLQNATGLPHFRFHDLRHYCASIQHAMGIPDAYIMQRGGWKSDTVLKQVYRHALSDQEKKMNDKVNQHFNQIMQHEMQHKK